MKKISSMNIKNQQGFTLVEIAIVLVIIGLLLGGVLKGQQLISSARVKSQIQQIDGIAAAINTYQDRYAALPGDDNNAAVNTGVAGLTPGSGNGDIGPGAEQNQLVWEHLQAAGLLAGYNATGNGQFINKYGLGTFVNSNQAGLPGAVVCSSVPNDIAREIDRKVDNGDGTSGLMRRNNQVAYPATGNSFICSAA